MSEKDEIYQWILKRKNEKYVGFLLSSLERAFKTCPKKKFYKYLIELEKESLIKSQFILKCKCGYSQIYDNMNSLPGDFFCKQCNKIIPYSNNLYLNYKINY